MVSTLHQELVDSFKEILAEADKELIDELKEGDKADSKDTRRLTFPLGQKQSSGVVPDLVAVPDLIQIETPRRELWARRQKDGL